MTGIELYSTTAASNNSAPPNGWPEGQAPSTVNDCARQLMASIRTWYEDAEWIKWGDTTAYVGATQFKIAGSDVTARYTVGRRVRAVGSSTGTIYGTISVSAFSTDTTITVVWDSGSLSNETLTISIGEIKGANGSLSYSPYIHGADVASASTLNFTTVNGDLFDVTGTTTVTAITLRDGQQVTIRATGVQTYTNGASLLLPGAANITSAAGDYFIFRGYPSGVVRCLSYQSLGASITPIVSIKTPAPFTANGTYTPSTGMVYCIIELLGGGGGGGGFLGSASNTGSSGGGGSAGYSKALFTASQIGASKAVVIGAAGSAGSSGNNSGGGGGNSTFGSTLLVANGGAGGSGSTVNASFQYTAGGAGGTVGSTSGTSIVIIAGQAGLPGISYGPNGANTGGAGAASIYGAGGANTGSTTGAAGSGYGSGGSGGSGASSSVAGGAGTAGICIVTEFCSQ